MLTDATIKAAKPGEPPKPPKPEPGDEPNAKPSKRKNPNGPYALTDGDGLSLLVTPEGGKLWRFRYRFNGKEKMISLGRYPDVPLKRAREKLLEARQLVADGKDPSAVRAQEKAKARGDTFAEVAKEWFDKQKAGWAPTHASIVWSRLENDVIEHIGKTPVAQLTEDDFRRCLLLVEKRGAVETAHRINQVCAQVMAYASDTNRATAEYPVRRLRRQLAKRKEVEHFASIKNPREIGALLRAIDGYEGHHVTQTALKLAPLVFTRPGELRHAEWSEINIEAAEWRIPGEKMKAGNLHIVPLSTQAVALLKAIQPLTGAGKYVFPSIRSASRPMSNNTINAALRRLGYTTDDVTHHGFRSTASTLLNEQGWNRDAIERQLAHVEKDKVRSAYHHADYLQERRKMMQAWADFLDGLKTDKSAAVIPLRAVAS